MAGEHRDDDCNLERDSQPELPTRKASLRFLVKRAIDMSFALDGLVLFAPLMGMIALLIRLNSRGLVLFKQLRRGYRGQEFWILKFRTTSVDAEQQLVELESSNESDGGVLFKRPNDPPITRLVGEIPERATSEADRQELSTRQEVARASIRWNRFGLLLHPQSKEKYLDPDLAEHAADLYEALTKAKTRGWWWRNLLIAYFTLKALLKAVNCHRIELWRMNMKRLFLVMIFSMLLGGSATLYFGRIVDKINLPFANDGAVLGRWTSVDFVDDPSQFDPEARYCRGDLFMKELKFRPGGKTSALLEGVGTSTFFTWTKGVVIHPGDKTAAKYEIKKTGDQEYLFLEWKSGDYLYLHRKPKYYVLKKGRDQP